MLACFPNSNHRLGLTYRLQLLQATCEVEGSLPWLTGFNQLVGWLSELKSKLTSKKILQLGFYDYLRSPV